ncbi:DUF3810 domain-containing protein [Myroides phaeus]|uniref:Amino acid permease n=1 Tax=Myroides phaeus TaxID=702745 RepID=A0A1G8EMC7_9FLAO|nr:DUF3810 domain-containing protein [Myroides phaeus]SDH71008.1 Protein of unknown function [Myroides phaeus]
MKLRYWLLCLGLFLIGFKSITLSPYTIESYYTNGFYKYYSTMWDSITHWIPFSIGDILYLIAILQIIKSLIIVFRRKKEWKIRVKTIAVGTIKFSIGFYILFTLGWGLNNFRPSLHSQLKIAQGYDNVELITLTKRIIKETNTIQLSLTNDSLKAVNNPFATEEILGDAKIGLKQITSTFHFDNIPSSIKKSLFSIPLTYMGFSGYINPFTNEAQVNYLIPKTTMIVTASHEVSHQLGYAKESDANFVGFMAAYHHPNEVYRYGANIFALRYCLSNIAKNEPDELEELLSMLNTGVMENINENTIFWNSYKNITDSFFKLFYSNFLKINNQKEGIHSYNKFVDLLINYDKIYVLYE